MKKIFLLLFIAFSFSGCEKDDICDEATSTTPNVVIEFFDKTNTTTAKSVTNLAINATGMTTGIAYTGSKIKLPLNISAYSVTFNFVQNGADTDTTNNVTDDLVFAYATKETYVSRACGFKTTYTLTSTNSSMITTNNWIDHVEIQTSNIETENETHLKIYF